MGFADQAGAVGVCTGDNSLTGGMGYELINIFSQKGLTTEKVQVGTEKRWLSNLVDKILPLLG